MKPLQHLRQLFNKIPRKEAALALLRVMTGVIFLNAGLEKLGNVHFAQQLPEMLTLWAGQNPYPLYKAFLNHVALPGAGLLAPMVVFGEIFVGLSYIVGFLVPLAAAAALVMNVNFYFAMQHTGGGAINLAFIAVSLALLIGDAGRCFGLDRFVFKPGSVPAKPPKAPKKAVRKSTGDKKLDKQVAKLAEVVKKNSKAATRPGGGKGKRSKPRNKPFG